MKFQAGDRVVCIDPQKDGSEHYMEWLGITGTVVKASDILKTYNVRFDVIPQHYSVMPEYGWWCEEHELDFLGNVTCYETSVEDLL